MASSRRLEPRKQPKQVRAQETRDRIVAAAAHVFAHHGYAAGTTNRIAEAAHVSIGSLYQYFPNKDALLVELMIAHLDAGVAITARHLSGGLPESLEDTLRLFVRATIDNHLDEPGLHRVLFEEAPRPATFLDALRAAEQRIVAAAAHLLEDHPEVTVTDPVLAARLVVATIESLVHRLIATARPVDPDVLEHELVSMLSRYLRGRSPTARACR